MTKEIIKELAWAAWKGGQTAQAQGFPLITNGLRERFEIWFEKEYKSWSIPTY